MATRFEHTNPRSRKPVEFKGTWKERNYRRSVLRALGINFLVFGVILSTTLYVAHINQQTRESPRVWTLGSQ